MLLGCDHVAPARYPAHVKEVPFCGKAYGCAFDEILTDLNSIYIKIDDDIIFIKDGSFEHLVYQVGAGVNVNELRLGAAGVH